MILLPVAPRPVQERAAPLPRASLGGERAASNRHLNSKTSHLWYDE